MKARNGCTAQCRAISRSTLKRCLRTGWVDSGYHFTNICIGHSNKRRNAGIVPSAAPPHETHWRKCRQCRKVAMKDATE